MKRLAAAAAIALAAVPAGAGGTVTASCTENGRVVYREAFPASESAQRRVRIAAMNPGAMCVFLDSAAGGRLPDAAGLLAAADGRQPAQGGLAAALAAIESGGVGQPYPPEAVAAMEAALGGQPAQGEAEDDGSLTLGLALGVYRGVPVGDVMAHWKAMQADSEALRQLTPTVQVMGEVAVLSVENVPQRLAADACEAAEKAGSGCLAAY